MNKIKIPQSNTLNSLLEDYRKSQDFKTLEILMKVYCPMFKAIFYFIKTNKIKEQDLIYSGLLSDIVTNTGFMDIHTSIFREFEDIELMTEFYLLLSNTANSAIENKNYTSSFYDSILLVNICAWISEKIKERLYEVNLDDLDSCDDELSKELNIEGL